MAALASIPLRGECTALSGAKRIPGEDAKQPLRNDLLLGTTPKIYQQLGFQADPLLYTRRHALKALAPKPLTVVISDSYITMS